MAKLTDDQERVLRYVACARYGVTIGQLASLMFESPDKTDRVVLLLALKGLVRQEGCLVYPIDPLRARLIRRLKLIGRSLRGGLTT